MINNAEKIKAEWRNGEWWQEVVLSFLVRKDASGEGKCRWRYMTEDRKSWLWDYLAAVTSGWKLTTASLSSCAFLCTPVWEGSRHQKGIVSKGGCCARSWKRATDKVMKVFLKHWIHVALFSPGLCPTNSFPDRSGASLHHLDPGSAQCFPEPHFPGLQPGHSQGSRDHKAPFVWFCFLTSQGLVYFGARYFVTCKLLFDVYCPIKKKFRRNNKSRCCNSVLVRTRSSTTFEILAAIGCKMKIWNFKLLWYVKTQSN